MRKLFLIAILLFVLPAGAADRVKVGFVSTLSGPNAAIGGDIRDGFNLALKLGGGKLGGLPAEVLIGDDQLKRSEEHTSELQSRLHLVCRLLLEKKKKTQLNQQP